MAMNILSPITKALSALRVKPANPDDRGLVNVILSNNAKIRVTHENAIEASAVWACIDIIASSLSSSDWNVYEGVRGADNTSATPEDVLHYILNTRMNPEMTGQAGKRALLLAAVGYGNGYAEIERDMAGRIIALWPIAPDRVEVRRPLEGGPLFYRVMQDYTGGFIDMEQKDIFHLRGAGLLGFMGDSVLLRSIQTVSQALALDAFASSYFGNNTQLGTVFVYKGGKLDDTHYGRLKETIEERHRGAHKAFRSAIFDGGDWDVKSIGTTADKAQLIEAKQQVIEDICRYFHVPPHKVQHLLRATNNNIEHQGLEFTRDTLRPWVKEIEQEADYKLVPYRARKFVQLDLDWAELGDYKSRAEAYQIYRNMGVFSANDVLRKLGENTIGAEGDIRIVQGANVRLEDVGIAYTNGTQAPDPADTPRTDDNAAQARKVIMIKAALPPSYREGTDAVKRCSNCEYFKSDLGFCERWEEVVQGTQVCDGWELKEDEDKGAGAAEARKRMSFRAELPGSYRKSTDTARRCEYCDYFKPDMGNLCERWGNAVAPDSLCDAWEAMEDDEEGPTVNVDVTLQNWLTSVYARIERRVINRQEQLAKTDPEHALERAREACKAYAYGEVEELAEVLGDSLADANRWAMEVINGCYPKIAALAALKGLK